MASVLRTSALNIQFHRTLLREKWTKWIHLVSKLISINLTQMPDTFQRMLTSNGVFTMKSMHAVLINSGPIFHRNHIRRTRVPSKIKVFMCFLQREVVLTEHNLAKCDWHGSKKCCFCDQKETIHHLFLSCPFTTLI